MNGQFVRISQEAKASLRQSVAAQHCSLYFWTDSGTPLGPSSGFDADRMDIETINVYRNSGNESHVLDALLETRKPPRTIIAGDFNAPPIVATERPVGNRVSLSRRVCARRRALKSPALIVLGGILASRSASST
ncbi:hypothetical protein E4U59_003992 [Claviceps monticola]|nr:hypothetical protein E4U59_003992 [Claviceps monticola]